LRTNDPSQFDPILDTAYAKNEKMDQWYNFDDSHVSPVANVESIKTSSAYLLFYRRRNAVVRTYEQRPATPASSGAGRSTNLDHGESSSSGMLSLRPTSIGLHSMDEDDDYKSWREGPYREIGPVRLTSSIHDEDEDDLPSYETALPISSYTDSILFVSDKGKGKAISMDNEDMDEMDSHDADLSTCASDGSNPGTAQASPGLTPSISTIVGSYPPQSDLSREGGRIDDSDEGMDTDESYEPVSMSTYDRIDDGEEVDMSASDNSVWQVVTPEVQEEVVERDEDDVEDGVNLVSYNRTSM
jgi:ubiquitin carboxyl-terminal hydrolase 4/11/15